MRIHWDRIARWALVAVFAVIVLLYIGPTKAFVAAHGEAAEKREQVAKLRARNAELRIQKRHLQSPNALERRARELGMVRAGERAYVVEGLPQP